MARPAMPAPEFGPEFEATKATIAQGIRDLRSLLDGDDQEVTAILTELHTEVKESHNLR